MEFGDFIVWTEDGIVVERIVRDRAFYEEALNNIEHVYVYGILPEIIGKWYTHTPIADNAGVVLPPGHKTEENGGQEDNSDDDEDSEKPRSYSEQPSYGNMICCDHKNCTIKWFHF